ncbi:MAG: HicB family protein [Peptococcaceae bacterium]|nr:HicB family protein [Peptococcaceae bacterium]MBQ3509471.1 type II toxin-antitoxin system HicB family antitoxin [Peptococcaceae bacterium]
MIKVYPAVFHQEDGSYWVEFPDIPGCYSDGSTLEDALTNAQEALAVHLSSLLDHQQPLPAASNLASIIPEDGVTSYVSCNPDKYCKKNKAVKKTLTIPEWLNDEAVAHNINFSKVLQAGLLRELGIN